MFPSFISLFPSTNETRSRWLMKLPINNVITFALFSRRIPEFFQIWTHLYLSNFWVSRSICTKSIIVERWGLYIGTHFLYNLRSKCFRSSKITLRSENSSGILCYWYVSCRFWRPLPLIDFPWLIPKFAKPMSRISDPIISSNFKILGTRVLYFGFYNFALKSSLRSHLFHLEVCSFCWNSWD